MPEIELEDRQAAQITDVSAPRISENTRWYGCVAALSFAYLFFDLFASPRVPFLLGGDQVFFWMGAQRLLSGQDIFRDFFQYTPPGTDLVYAAFFRVLGGQIWTTNAVVLALGVLSTCLCFSLSRQLMKSSHALVAAGLFLVVIYGMFLNATNHWFSVFFIVLAVRVCVHQLTTGRVALAGVLLALAAFFNQAHGAAALAGFIVFFLLSGRHKDEAAISLTRSIAVLTLAFAVAVLCIATYYLSTAGFDQIWFCLVTSVANTVRRTARYLVFLGLPPGLSKTRMLPYLAIYLLLPMTYSVALLKCWRSRCDQSFPWRPVLIVALIGTFLLAEVAVSVNPLRLFAIAMPGIVLLIWLIGRSHLSPPMLIIGASLLLAAVSLHQIVEKHRLGSARGEVAGGRFATTPETYDKLQWLAQRIRPGDYFLQAGWPGLYLPLKAQSPIYMQTLAEWDCVTEKDIEPAIEQVDARQTRYVLWTSTLDRQCEFATCNDYLTQFRQYLTTDFQLVQTFADGDTVWERASGRPATHTAF